MRLATHTPGAPQGAAIGRHSRAFSLAPAALLVVCVFGFAWTQITADAAHPIPLPAATSQSAGNTTVAAAPGVEPPAMAALAPAPAAATAHGADARTAADEVPSLEDQELASYSTCGV